MWCVKCIVDNNPLDYNYEKRDVSIRNRKDSVTAVAGINDTDSDMVSAGAYVYKY